MEQRVRPLFLATLDALEPLTGKNYLDAGCGSGQAAAEAARRGAVVFGLDASEPLLEVARARTPDGEFRVGEIQELPYADASFDVVTATNAIQYAVDPAAAVAELARVTRSGGRVGIGIWGDPARCETEGLFARLRALAPPPPGAPAPLACSDAGVVEELLVKAGLQVVDGDEVPVPIAFDSLDDAWRAHSSAGPLQKVIDTVGTEKVRAVIESVLEADRKPDGSLRQDNVMRYVIAAKP
jgi:SAM-dependent methyltransferase